MLGLALLLIIYLQEPVSGFGGRIAPSRSLFTPFDSLSSDERGRHTRSCRQERKCLEHPPRPTTSTTLHVSELHVPGYAQTKLPFILSPEEDETRSSGSQQLLAVDKHWSGCRYESSIPYEGGCLLHKTTEPVFTSQECQLVVNEAERVASTVMDWTKNRHGNYPTTDLPIAELPQTLDMFKHTLVQRIYPLLRSQFASFLPDPSKLRVADGFIVKYDAVAGQTSLKPHRDGSVLSFNIALNPSEEYEGGGTWFASNDSAVRIECGQMCSHASALLHGGHPITSGTRYILVAFVILEGFDNWSMRFYNQVRNL
jgi:hypothetical protein